MSYIKNKKQYSKGEKLNIKETMFNNVLSTTKESNKKALSFSFSKHKENTKSIVNQFNLEQKDNTENLFYF